MREVQVEVGQCHGARHAPRAPVTRIVMDKTRSHCIMGHPTIKVTMEI